MSWTCESCGDVNNDDLLRCVCGNDCARENDRLSEQIHDAYNFEKFTRLYCRLKWSLALIIMSVLIVVNLKQQQGWSVPLAIPTAIYFISYIYFLISFGKLIIWTNRTVWTWILFILFTNVPGAIVAFMYATKIAKDNEKVV